MISLLDLFSLATIGAGTFFFVAGTVGLLRFPDSLSRLHALTKADNLGLGLVVLGLIPRMETSLAAFKLVLMWGLVKTSGGSTAQLIGRALRRGEQQPIGDIAHHRSKQIASYDGRCRNGDDQRRPKRSRVPAAHRPSLSCGSLGQAYAKDFPSPLNWRQRSPHCLQ